MRLTNTTLAIEIAVLLGIFVGVEWLAHFLTDTRDNFAFGLLFCGVYFGIRMATSARPGRNP